MFITFQIWILITLINIFFIVLQYGHVFVKKKVEIQNFVKIDRMWNENLFFFIIIIKYMDIMMKFLKLKLYNLLYEILSRII